jgi:ABC-type multidrug transport system ATPase subunit
LKEAANKQIRFYSSGMKQRLKLAQAFFCETNVLLLDEPCSNLDETGIQMYRSWINDYTKDRVIIIASNDKQEYDFCKEIISMSHFKSLSPRGNQ